MQCMSTIIIITSIIHHNNYYTVYHYDLTQISDSFGGHGSDTVILYITARIDSEYNQNAAVALFFILLYRLCKNQQV